MRRSSRSITLVLITSPLILTGCGRSYDNGNSPGHSGGAGFHGGGGGFRGGGAIGHASPSGGFGGFGHGGGAGE